MDTLTLDTNILNDWLWAESKTPFKRYNDDPMKRSQFLLMFNELKKLRDAGMCELGVTTQLYTDHSETGSKLPEHIESIIGSYVALAGPSLMILPFTLPAVFVNEEELEKLFKDTFPQSKKEDKQYPNNRKDLLQLYAHRVTKRDYFITHDQPILRKHETLLRNWQIHVLTLEQYLSQITNP